MSLISVSFAQHSNSYVITKPEDKAFAVSEWGHSSPIIADSHDYPGVIRVVKELQGDIKSVTGTAPAVYIDSVVSAREIIIAGTIGKSALVDSLISLKKISVDDIKGKWESFIIQVVENPLPGIKSALVIAGSDKRGTIYGLYDFSEKLGVSPWAWWADVPVKQHHEVYVRNGRYTMGEPKVKYRGFFINDEAPALSGWAAAKFGTEKFNHHMYEQVFDLVLRLKGNFLWPGMWGRAFYDDDSLNPKLADEYGVVIGTSHHEPMMRAHDEWRRYGNGPWNYEKNEAKLKEFWRKGIQRMGNYESIVTLAMRGDGDEPMSEDANISLLQKIVSDQRKILVDVTGKKLEDIPQVWALYKEVQNYYDKGMRVPDDVTLLLCDDNWGNVRKLPRPGQELHKGGYGMYYHFDYVGAPRNYKWLNTNQIERTWEQLHLCYEYGVDRIWIVNVGDIKPMEFPMSFFFDYAWDPTKISAKDLPGYYTRWAEEQFGPSYATTIGTIIARYSKFNARRKPELLDQNTYSLTNYNEAENVVAEYKNIERMADSINTLLPPEYKDAYFELVLHPVQACANLNDLYLAAAKNAQYYKQGRAATNVMADKVKALFKRDAEISNYYNTAVAGGKWTHMMDQTHIGYTYWQQPDSNVCPAVKYNTLPQKADLGVTVEGSDKWFPETKVGLELPDLDKEYIRDTYVEVFNRGKGPLKYTIKSDTPWLVAEKTKGIVDIQERIAVSVNPELLPARLVKGHLRISGPNKETVTILVNVDGREINQNEESFSVFHEVGGYVSIAAEDYNEAVGSGDTTWQVIPNLGKTSSAVSAVPVTAFVAKPEGNSPHLEYNIDFKNAGKVKVTVYLSPTVNFLDDKSTPGKKHHGLRYGISFNDEQPQIVDIHEKDTIADWRNGPVWMQAVSDNIRKLTTTHVIGKTGNSILKFWLVDPGVVLQKIVIDRGGVKPSYLGPSNSFQTIVVNLINIQETNKKEKSK